MKREIALSLLLSFLTFTIGVLLGHYITSKQTEKMWMNYENIRVLVNSALYSLEDLKNTCDIENLRILGKKVDSIGYEVSILERKYVNSGIPIQLKLLKSQYFNLQYLHYLLTKNMRENCKNNNITILFYFYKGEKECSKCEEEGYQLSHLKKRHPYEIFIYSFDITYPNYFIYYYKEKYKISEVPAILIMKNNKTILVEGYKTWKELENIIYKL